MDAVTKTRLPDQAIVQITRAALGEEITVQHIRPLSGGFCSAVYLVETSQGRLVLKVGTNANVKVMRHEVQYIPTEARMLRLIGENTDIPMPRLIAFDDSCSIVHMPYFFMSWLDGAPLSGCTDLTEEQLHSIHRQVGVVTRKICGIPEHTFGIPLIPESQCSCNRAFVYLLFDWLLQDAEEEHISIPYIEPDGLRALVKACAEELDTAQAPVLVHTDTWAGNVMVQSGAFAGMVDFAALYYGDFLMSHDFHDFGEKPDPYFLEGFGKTSFDVHERIRIQVYRVWQRLGMVVERGFRKYEDPDLYAWVLPEMEPEVRRLEQMMNQAALK